MSEHLVILGDSVTVGSGFSGTSEETRYVSSLEEALLHSGVQLTITSSALDGVDTSYALRRFDRMVRQLEPDVVVVFLGLNDAHPPGDRAPATPSVFANNLDQLVGRILDIEAQPVLTTPPPRIDADFEVTTLYDYAQAVRERGRHWNVPVVDVFAQFESRTDLSELLPDGLHPSPKGHALIAECFFDSLAPRAPESRKLFSAES